MAAHAGGELLSQAKVQQHNLQVLGVAGASCAAVAIAIGTAPSWAGVLHECVPQCTEQSQQREERKKAYLRAG